MGKNKPKRQKNNQIKKEDALTKLIWDLQNLAELIDDQKHRTIEELRDRKKTKEQLLIELKEISEFTQNHTVGLVKKIDKYPPLVKWAQEVLVVVKSIITIIEDAHSDIDLNESDKKKESLYSRFLRTFKRANGHRNRLELLSSLDADAEAELTGKKENKAIGTDKPPGKIKNIKDRFGFAPGQALFDCIDIGLPTGLTIDVLKKLVENFGFTTLYNDLDENSGSKGINLSVQLKRAISRIRKSFLTKRISCMIETKSNEGYLIKPGQPNIKSSPKNHKKHT